MTELIAGDVTDGPARRWTVASVSSGHSDVVVAHGDHVAPMQLAAASSLDLGVHPHLAGRDQRLGLGSRVDQAGQLQELTQANHVVADIFVSHLTIIAATACDDDIATCRRCPTGPI